jgi:hypothetical protein
LVDTRSAAARCRDIGILFVLVQLTIASIAKVVHLLDSGEMIPTLFPREWAARSATVLAVGPYYCTGAVFFFAGARVPSLTVLALQAPVGACA